MDKVKHVRILAWLYIANGLITLLVAVGVLIGVTLGGVFSGELTGIVTAPVVGVIAFLFVAIFAVPSLLTGKGLLEGRGWARVLAMILGVFNILSFPLGTALGIYTFMVLWGPEADYVFEPGYSRRYE